jgi:hypothetical protein
MASVHMHCFVRMHSPSYVFLLGIDQNIEGGITLLKQAAGQRHALAGFQIGSFYSFLTKATQRTLAFVL